MTTDELAKLIPAEARMAAVKAYVAAETHTQTDTVPRALKSKPPSGQ